MKINIDNCATQLKKISLIENIVVIYFCLGMFYRYESAIVISYIISILLQMYTLIYFSSNKMLLNRVVKVYSTVMCLIFCIMIVFVAKNVETIKIINRIGPLVSVFGLFIICLLELNVYNIVKKIVNVSCYLLFIIDIDALLFMITGNAIWKPINYIGYRYSGFFADPNFMAFFSASILILLLFYGKNNISKYIFKIVCVLVNVVIANSLSAFLILVIVFVIPFFIKIKSTFKKQILILLIYVVFLLIFSMYNNEIGKIMINIFSEWYENSISATVKYISFERRFDTQIRAISIFLTDVWGQGPLQIVQQLGMDTHNSYIGIMFEQGIFGLLLILVSVNNFSRDTEYNIWIDRWGYFIMIFALVLNIHYTTVNALFLLFIHGYKKMELESVSS